MSASRYELGVVLQILAFAQGFLSHTAIESGKLGLGFHKVQHLNPADAITIPEVPVDCPYQFQILHARFVTLLPTFLKALRPAIP